MPRRTKADNKTRRTEQDVAEFIAEVPNPGRREDARVLLELMTRITGTMPYMYGPTIIGFGEYHYVYDSGREGGSFLVGFAPRRANMVIYIMPGFSGYADLLEKLGKHKTGASCLYLGRLSGVDMAVLEELIERSIQHMRKKYGD
jgi:hypothetical protein